MKNGSSFKTLQLISDRTIMFELAVFFNSLIVGLGALGYASLLIVKDHKWARLTNIEDLPIETASYSKKASLFDEICFFLFY